MAGRRCAGALDDPDASKVGLCGATEQIRSSLDESFLLPRVEFKWRSCAYDSRISMD